MKFLTGLFLCICAILPLQGAPVPPVDDEAPGLISSGQAAVAVVIPEESLGSRMGGLTSEEAGSEPLHLGVAFGKMVAFIAVIVTLGGIMILVKRRGGIFMSHRHQSKIRIGETLHLGTKHYLAVVEYENQRFLVGISSGGIAKIGDLSESNQTRTRV